MDYHPDVAHYLNAKLRLFRDLVVTGGAAVISADHDCSQTVIDAARARKLRIVTVGSTGGRRRRGHSSGRGRHRRLCADSSTLEHRGRTIHDAAAAGRRIPDRECAGVGRTRDRHRQRSRGGVRERSNCSKAPRAGSSGSPNATARRSSSITPTSPMRWRRRCRRCGLTPSAGWSWCSAPAATAMPASGR